MTMKTMLAADRVCYHCRFVFVMGTSIAMSFHAARRRAVPKSKLFRRIVRRTVILFMLGLTISNRGIVHPSLTAV